MSVVSVDVPANAIAAALLEDGYVILERLASDLTDRALAELSADIDAAPTGHTDFLGNRTKRLGGLRQEENQYLANPPEIARTIPVSRGLLSDPK